MPKQSVRVKCPTMDMESGRVCERTEFMWHSKRCLKAVVLYNWAASFGVTHSANISYTQSVTILISTNILESKRESDKWANEKERCETKKRSERRGEGDTCETLISSHRSISSRQPFFPQAGSCQQNIFVSVSIVKWSKYKADCVLEKKQAGKINCEIAGPHSIGRPIVCPALPGPDRDNFDCGRRLSEAMSVDQRHTYLLH